ncbi:MAG: 3-oxoadipyl-CoA thiolase [Planctomycetota bacterium]
MTNAFICDGIRSPIAKHGGSLSSIRIDDLSAHVIRALLARHSKLDPARIDEVVLGNANQAGEDNRNLARMVALLAGLPITVPGTTVNSLCSSGMNAVVLAARAIATGEWDLAIAGGAESMTRAPYVLSKNAEPFARDMQLFDTSIGWRFVNPKMKELYGIDAMGETAENVAEQFKISRADMDAFAVASQRKAATAQSRGRLASEIVAVDIPQRKGPSLSFAQDEFIRADTTIESLTKLKPAFRQGGSVTAGNSSGINDGACALLIASERAAVANGLRRRARIVTAASAGVEPRIMGMGPVPATKAALAKAGLTLAQMDVIELNEAFAAQSLACLRELGLADTDPRVNPNGGAIALGHPLGMSGARLLLTAVHELEQRQQRYALCTMCVGVGQGLACIIERVA